MSAMKSKPFAFSPVLALAVALALAEGGVAGIIYSPTSKDDWSSFVNGQFTTIGFTGDYLQFVTEQYADLGVHFSDGDDYGVSNSKFTDGFGIKGNCCGGGSITVTFDAPQTWVAANYLGILKIALYMDDVFIDSKDIFQPGVLNKFQGVVSDVAFNKVILSDTGDGLPFVDDLHFGGPIPAPGVLAAFVGAAGLSLGGRRRTR